MLNVLIKPASSLCNMRCKYCFYRDVADNRENASFGMMTEEVADAFLKNVFAYEREQVGFAFQGGEPTLAGEDFFHTFHALVERYNVHHVPVSYSLQTNGYEIGDGLLAIFSKYHYLLGVSVDGDEALHDALRPAVGGLPTHQRICETLARLERYRIDYNILTVITEDVAKRGVDVYRYFKSKGLRYLQFIPFIPDFCGAGEGETFTLTNDSYAFFLNETFRVYYEDFVNGSYVSVRQFDNFVRIAAGLVPECCGMGGSCNASLVVEADGGVYPCDFYVLDKWKMGNITQDSVQSLLSSQAARDFVISSRNVGDECRRCPYFPVCRGGCRRHKEGLGGELLQNRYCSAYKAFFENSAALILDMAKRLRANTKR